MSTTERYLKFASIDMAAPDIHARCSDCAKEISAVPEPNEKADDLFTRMRAEYEAHNC